MSNEPSEDVGPPPAFNVWQDIDDDNSSTVINYTVRHPWKWVMKDIRSNRMIEVANASELPSTRLLAHASADDGASPAPRFRRRFSSPKQRAVMASTLKIEVYNPAGENIVFAAHGSSSALDGLEDKDELVRTMQRCRCEDKHLSPPSVLLNWDVTHEECLKLVGSDLPVVKGNNLDDPVAVLKEPMGSQGKGVFFVRTAEDIHKIVSEHRQRAMDKPGYLDNLIAAKGRIPSWVLQAEVVPSLLIRGRRKFHIRTYVVIIEKLWSPDLLDTYIFNRHEVRVAGVPVPENDTERNREANITNGALSSKTERLLLDDVEELASRGLKDKIELFVATTFGSDLVKDIAGRICVSARTDSNDIIQKFAVAGLDLMVTENNRIYLLEVNVNPAAPPEDTVTETFKEHLKGFLRDVTDLVVGKVSPNFVTADQIMTRHGILPQE